MSFLFNVIYLLGNLFCFLIGLEFSDHIMLASSPFVELI
jgi:hypothetical protein